MVFQVYVRSNDRNRRVTVAQTEAEALAMRVEAFKELVMKETPEINDPERIRLLFGDTAIEDNQTLGECHIKHGSLIFIVLKMPGGGCDPEGRAGAYPSQHRVL